MSIFTKRLTFRSINLGRDATLVFTFNDEKIPGMYKDIFPTALKVTQFGATGGYSFELVYHSQLGFTRTEVASDIVQPASTYIPINVGQETTLTNQGALYHFSTPQDIEPPVKQMVAHNSTNEKENIGVGYFHDSDPANPPSTMFFFEGVGSGSYTQIQFTPVLRIYLSTDYRENEVMRGQIYSPSLFEHDLAQLADETFWRLAYNPATGVFTITQE